MAIFQAWCSAVALVVCGTMAAAVVPSISHSQNLTIGLVGQQWSSEAREGIDDALDDINNSTELLLGYRLKYFQHIPLPGNSSEVIAIVIGLVLSIIFCLIIECMQ